jgi:molybdopterin converting factor small subunit
VTRGVRRLFSLVVIVAVLALRWWQRSDDDAPSTTEPAAAATSATETRLEGQVEGVGVVQRVLADDNDGSRHQRFILELADGRTVLVAHNIDLAPRLTNLDRGDTVAFFGEFEPNPQGGVIHWTHRDPAGRHVAGWLKHDGRTVR